MSDAADPPGPGGTDDGSGAEIAVGVDVGGTKILGVALALVPTPAPAPGLGRGLGLTADDGGAETLGAPVRVPTPSGADAVLHAVGMVVEAVRAARGPGCTVGAVGVGLPGLVDRQGVLRVGPNLPNIVDVAFAAMLRERLRTPVTVDNDATCAMWAEHQRGGARGARDALLVTLGTGIGGGIVAGGQLQRGANGFAAEPGHMVVDPNGPRCPCGGRGCWERFASGTGLGRLARDEANAGRAARIVALAGGDAESVRGEHVTGAAAEGDAEALEVLADFAWWVALGLANLANLLDPELVVVGGGLADAGELLLAPVRHAFGRLVMAGSHRPAVRIVGAELGEEAGAIGAALLAAARA